jgi:hypothetical protein
MTAQGSNLFASGAFLVVLKELMRHRDIKPTLNHYSDESQLPLAAAVANPPALTVASAARAANPVDGRRICESTVPTTDRTGYGSTLLSALISLATIRGTSPRSM